MPLHAQAEAPARRLDCLDDAVTEDGHLRYSLRVPRAIEEDSGPDSGFDEGLVA